MDIHSCSYFCDRPECIKAQRDELRTLYATMEIERDKWLMRSNELGAKVESQSEIIAELTFNQRLQDAATAAVQERAEKAEAAIKTHNEQCIHKCNSRAKYGVCAYREYIYPNNKECHDCPKEHIIELE